MPAQGPHSSAADGDWLPCPRQKGQSAQWTSPSTCCSNPTSSAQGLDLNGKCQVVRSLGGWTLPLWTIWVNWNDYSQNTYIYIYVCMYVCTYVRTYVCMYVGTYVCMYVFMYAYTYIQYTICSADFEWCKKKIKCLGKGFLSHLDHWFAFYMPAQVHSKRQHQTVQQLLFWFWL